MKRVLFIFCLFAAFVSKVNAQYVSHYSLDDHIQKDTLTDSSGRHFVVDKERITVTAYDSAYKQIWKTDPYKDNGIPEYRTARPKLVMFKLALYEGKSRFVSNTPIDSLAP